MKDSKQVGYLGPEGTFTHEATMQIVDDNMDIIPYDSITKVLEAVSNNQINEAVVPIENSTEGSVDITLDLLAHSFDLKISQELILPIKQNLLVQKGKTIDDIKVICSHSQAIAQCRNYLNKLNIPLHAMPSTANAARYVTELSDAAVIGNKILAEIYGLELLDTGIQDYTNNVTRFAVISKKDQLELMDNCKTSIIFSLKEDNPGSLYEILKEFAIRKLNLTKIESRPSKEGLGKYLFFIDIEGHRTEPSVKSALEQIEDKTNKLKVLGSYFTTTVGGY